MYYQKYTSINIPKNMELKQIFIAQNTFDYWMILEENKKFKLYKNWVTFWDNIDFNFPPYWIISKDGTIIRTKYFEKDKWTSLCINGLIPKNYYNFIWISNWEIELSKNRKYSFAYWIDKENNKFLIRNDDKLLNLDGFDDNYVFSDNWENFLIVTYNTLYLNWEVELYSIDIENEIIFYKLFDNLEWILVYENSNNFYVIKNWKEVNRVILENWLIVENFLHINNDWSKLYLLISKDIDKDDNLWVSINWKNTEFLFSHNLSVRWWETISPYGRYYWGDTLFISSDTNSIIYKCMSMEKRTYILVHDEKIIFEWKNIVDNESSFYLWDIGWFENKDIEILFCINKENIHWKKYLELQEKIQKDFDKIESLVIWDDWLIKFIWYKQNDIWLYYFKK